MAGDDCPFLEARGLASALFVLDDAALGDCSDAHFFRAWRSAVEAVVARVLIVFFLVPFAILWLLSFDPP
jgi:hypothetical protein